MTQHPPGYYWYEALILRAGGAAGWRWDIAVSVMRLLSALLVVWTPLLAWATTYRITRNRLAGIAASVLPLGVPEFTHIGATVNNDNLITLTGAAVLLGCACAATGDRSRGTAIWTGLWLAASLWAKMFGLVLVPLVVVAYAIPWVTEQRKLRKDRRIEGGASGALHPCSRKPTWRPDRRTASLVALAAGLGVALGCWWYLINEVRYGSAQPSVPNFPPGRFLGDNDVLFTRYSTQAMLLRWWGSMGWFEVNLPWRLVVGATLVVGGLGLWALVRLSGRRLALALMLWPTVMTYFVLVVTTGHYYLTTHYLRGLSGRYLFIGFTGIAVLMGAGCGALPKRIARWTPLALLIGAIGMQIEAAHLSIDHWWRPAKGTLRQAWSAFSAWSTWPVGVLWAGMGLLVIATIAALYSCVRFGLQAGDADLTEAVAYYSEPAAAGETVAGDKAVEPVNTAPPARLRTDAHDNLAEPPNELETATPARQIGEIDET